MQKEIDIKVEDREKKTEGIAFLVQQVQILMSMNDKLFAEEIMVKEKEIKDIHYLADSEISTELLFRLHYVATVLLENPYLEEFAHNQARKLKKACQEEISRRDK